MKKREEHSLFVLCDTNQNNTVNKEEFVSLFNKGENLLKLQKQPKKNSLFLKSESEQEPDEESNEIITSKRKKKARLVTQDTSQFYSGDVKSELVKIIHERDFISIEQFFTSAFNWKLTDFVTFDKFYKKGSHFFQNIPEEDLQTLFDDLDLSGEGKIKVKNIVNELKSQVQNEDKETISLLTVQDIQPRYGKMSPRTSSSFLIQEIKEH